MKALSLLAIICQAVKSSRFFHSDGSLSQRCDYDPWCKSHADRLQREFDEVFAEHGGRISAAPAEGYNNSHTAILFSQEYDETWTERYHSEVGLHNAYIEGETIYYSLAFKLPSHWEYTPQVIYNYFTRT